MRGGVKPPFHMKLATLKAASRDGTLALVSTDLQRVRRLPGWTLQRALEEWDSVQGELRGEPDAPLDPAELLAPLPRAYEFVDGSAYLPHVERVRKARGAEVPQSFYVDPLMYQATSAGFLSPLEPVRVSDEAFGIDLEAEVVVVTNDVPMGVSPAEAARHIVLIGLVNDVSLRNLIPDELAKGFGFLQSKPRSSLSPVFVTPDELGDAWRGNKVCLPLRSYINGAVFGAPEAGDDMQFDFAQLIAHAAKTRPLSAGTIVGSGTVANQDTSRGASCLAEKRTLEVIATGKASTPFLKFGDTIKIEMLAKDGRSIFGAIEQRIERA